jgi:hypothetical protein
MTVDGRAGVPNPTVTTNSSVLRFVPVLSGIVTDGASAGGATGGGTNGPLGLLGWGGPTDLPRLD